MRKTALVLLRCPRPLLATAASAPAAGAGEYGQCGFDSDCHGGVKCNSGKCADSAGSSCGFRFRTVAAASANSGRCANAPDGKCGFDSDCGRGGHCSSQKCTW